MTKAASYLIWDGGFSGIRNYLLAEHGVDGVGLDGHPAARGEEGRASRRPRTASSRRRSSRRRTRTSATQMVEMWAKQPKRRLPFRYGYPDLDKHVHLMITAPRRREDPAK